MAEDDDADRVALRIGAVIADPVRVLAPDVLLLVARAVVGMALRLCQSLSLKGEGAQGHAYNNAGDKQKDIWGKHADWVCYYGPDPKGNAVGVVVFSHPSNLRSPETWHARDYGLFAVNPFGLHDFEGLKKGDQDGKGDYKIAKGGSLSLRYRFYLAKGKPKPEALEAKFKEYSAQ
jgi:hypothetical protein